MNTALLHASLAFVCLGSLLACESSMVDGDGASGGSLATGGAASGSGGGALGGGTGLPEGECPSAGFVTLTYDDSLTSQLNNAAPALKSHGLRATFFLTNTSSAWSALRNDGHELASHTILHPCPAAAWVTPGNASEDYDLARMEAELDDSIANVAALGEPEPLTFAYPCGVMTVGEDKQSYVPLVEQRFSGARGVVGSVIKTLADPYNVPAYFSKGDGPALIAIADSAVTQAGWVVFGFHGVGGDFEEVTLEAHEALLSHLEEAAIPVLTFAEGLACKKP